VVDEVTTAPWAQTAVNRATLDGAAIAWLTVDNALAGAVLLRDPLRRLRAAGLARLVMLTGDRQAPAREIGSVLGLDAVRAGLSPTDKVTSVREEQEHAVTVMAGDGVNDAPALAAATVGWPWARGVPRPPPKPPTSC
jgi:P-type E1-E2 ATPase